MKKITHDQVLLTFLTHYIKKTEERETTIFELMLLKGHKSEKTNLHSTWQLKVLTYSGDWGIEVVFTLFPSFQFFNKLG